MKSFANLIELVESLEGTDIYPIFSSLVYITVKASSHINFEDAKVVEVQTDNPSAIAIGITLQALEIADSTLKNGVDPDIDDSLFDFLAHVEDLCFEVAEEILPDFGITFKFDDIEYYMTTPEILLFFKRLFSLIYEVVVPRVC